MYIKDTNIKTNADKNWPTRKTIRFHNHKFDVYKIQHNGLTMVKNKLCIYNYVYIYMYI